MKVVSRLLMGVVFAGIAIAQTPTITSGGVTNGASYASPDLPSGTLAQGSLIVIKGNNLGPDKTPTFSSYPLPLQQDGTSVKVTCERYRRRCLHDVHVESASCGNPAVPQHRQGAGTLTVTYNGQTSAAASNSCCAFFFWHLHA